MKKTLKNIEQIKDAFPHRIEDGNIIFDNDTEGYIIGKGPLIPCILKSHIKKFGNEIEVRKYGENYLGKTGINYSPHFFV